MPSKKKTAEDLEFIQRNKEWNDLKNGKDIDDSKETRDLHAVKSKASFVRSLGGKVSGVPGTGNR